MYPKADISAADISAFLRLLDQDELEAFIGELRDEQVKRALHARAGKRERDAERYMDVHCPTCGAGERMRCLESGKRLEISHPQRAWKTVACPACGAAPGEWCRVGPVNVDRAHMARVGALEA